MAFKNGVLGTVLSGVLAVVLAPAARGQVFNDRNAFLAAAGSVVEETFEDEPLVGTSGGGAVALLNVTDFSIVSTVGPSIKILGEPFFGNLNTTPGGARYVSMDTDLGNTSYDHVLTFPWPLRSFGLYLIDLEQGGRVTINGVSYEIVANGNGGISFFGLISSNEFTQVTLDFGTTDSHSSYDDVLYVRSGAACRPDLTTTAVVGSPGYGVPNGSLNSEDFFYYLAQYASGNLAVADLTTTAVVGSPGYGVPNGVLNSEDFFFYLALYAAGC